MRTHAFTGILGAIACLLCIVDRHPAHAEDILIVRPEVRGDLLIHRSNELDLDLQGLSLGPDLSIGWRRSPRLHFLPLVGVTRATARVRARFRRTVSTERLQGRITEATDSSPRQLTVPTRGINAPPGLLPPTISFPIGEPGDTGEEIPDEVTVDLPFSADIELPWTPTFGFRLAVDILPHSRFLLEPYADHRRSIGETRATIRSVSVDAAGVGLDMGFLRSSVELTDRWSVSNIGVRLGYRARDFRPYLDCGVLHLRNTYIARSRGALAVELREAGTPDHAREQTVRNLPFYAVGAEIDLGPRLTLRLAATAAAGTRFSTMYFDSAFIFPLGK